MKKLAVLVFFLSAPALAQQGPVEYTVKIPSQMLNQIGMALDELPGHIRKPIVDEIVKQVNAQNVEFAKTEEAKKAPALKPPSEAPK